MHLIFAEIQLIYYRQDILSLEQFTIHSKLYQHKRNSKRIFN
jgi:hypothetical protein